MTRYFQRIAAVFLVLHLLAEPMTASIFQSFESRLKKPSSTNEIPAGSHSFEEQGVVPALAAAFTRWTSIAWGICRIGGALGRERHTPMLSIAGQMWKGWLGVNTTQEMRDVLRSTEHQILSHSAFRKGGERRQVYAWWIAEALGSYHANVRAGPLKKLRRNDIRFIPSKGGYGPDVRWFSLVYVDEEGRIVVHEEFLIWLEARTRSHQEAITYLADLLGHENTERSGGSHDAALRNFPLSRIIETWLVENRNGPLPPLQSGAVEAETTMEHRNPSLEDMWRNPELFDLYDRRRRPFRVVHRAIVQDLVQRYLDSAGVILELGSGRGELASLLTPAQRKKLIQSDRAAEHLQENPYPTEKRVIDATDISMPDSSVPAVVSFAMLDTILDLPKALQEIHRILTSGGILLGFLDLVPSHEAMMARYPNDILFPVDLPVPQSTIRAIRGFIKVNRARFITELTGMALGLPPRLFEAVAEYCADPIQAYADLQSRSKSEQVDTVSDFAAIVDILQSASWLTGNPLNPETFDQVDRFAEILKESLTHAGLDIVLLEPVTRSIVVDRTSDGEIPAEDNVAHFNTGVWWYENSGDVPPGKVKLISTIYAVVAKKGAAIPSYTPRPLTSPKSVAPRPAIPPDIDAALARAFEVTRPPIVYHDEPPSLLEPAGSQSRNQAIVFHSGGKRYVARASGIDMVRLTPGSRGELFGYDYTSDPAELEFVRRTIAAATGLPSKERNEVLAFIDAKLRTLGRSGSRLPRSGKPAPGSPPNRINRAA